MVASKICKKANFINTLGFPGCQALVYSSRVATQMIVIFIKIKINEEVGLWQSSFL